MASETETVIADAQFIWMVFLQFTVETFAWIFTRILAIMFSVSNLDYEMISAMEYVNSAYNQIEFHQNIHWKKSHHK